MRLPEYKTNEVFIGQAYARRAIGARSYLDRTKKDGQYTLVSVETGHDGKVYVTWRRTHA